MNIGDIIEGKHIDLYCVSSTGKTLILDIRSKEDKPLILGTIRWFSAWRKYCFYPSNLTIFEQDCLRQIADWIEKLTSDHKAAKKLT
jgi:hypothetical protein